MNAIRDSLTDRSPHSCTWWDLLRVAIVELAISDYKLALDGIVPKYAGSQTRFCTVDALESFFLSEWGEFLCGRPMAGPLEVVRRQVREYKGGRQ